MERTCPLCKRTFLETRPEPHRPFCSPTCKRADLQNWLNGSYRLPRELVPEDIDGLTEEEQAELFLRLTPPKGALS